MRQRGKQGTPIALLVNLNETDGQRVRFQAYWFCSLCSPWEGHDGGIRQQSLGFRPADNISALVESGSIQSATDGANNEVIL